MSWTCHVQVLYLSCTCPVQVLYLSHTCPTQVPYLSCTGTVPVLYLSYTFLISVPYLSHIPYLFHTGPGPIPYLSHTGPGHITYPHFILIGWLPITLFQMLNFHQSLYSKVGLIVPDCSPLPSSKILRAPISITKLTLTSQQKHSCQYILLLIVIGKPHEVLSLYAFLLMTTDRYFLKRRSIIMIIGLFILLDDFSSLFVISLSHQKMLLPK